ncbi:hypothetical protein [Vulcanisaeta souniana]|uniref:Uncharacterized protein n=1 Tax=Vulcanisaeta souniana JCM 11219 TaxID=1293586 RepID=A0A830EG25_9CREN|nr:hypothetical protein [Vulcanisaeta souniana]BDR90917.1 hypothetical protein Vsou_00100 [Vulcanisaeta souniana JCM 11219]GGI79316.1 hypothetical protein GCM10007112_15300 [Vulcanisaeta souniana JCM 11219]
MVFTIIAVVITITITLALEWDGLVNDVKKPWSLGGLIIKLRWLYHELQGIQAWSVRIGTHY